MSIKAWINELNVDLSTVTGIEVHNGILGSFKSAAKTSVGAAICILALSSRSRLRDNHDLSLGEILTFQSVVMNDHGLRTVRISTMAIS
jgi:hypothetical protein